MSRIASLVSERGSPLTRSEKLDLRQLVDPQSTTWDEALSIAPLLSRDSGRSNCFRKISHHLGSDNTKNMLDPLDHRLLIRDPWLDRLEAKLDARFDEVRNMLQELFVSSREEETGVEEEEEEEIAIDKAEKEEDDEAAVVIEEEEEIEEEEKKVEGGSTNTHLEQQQQMGAILGPDLAPFQALISQLMSAANDQRLQAKSPFNLCRERHPDALALKLAHLLRFSLRLEIRGMSAILLRKQLTRDSSSSETPSSIEQSIHIHIAFVDSYMHLCNEGKELKEEKLVFLASLQLTLQCSSGVCKNALKKGELQIAIKLEMTMEVGDDELLMPLPRPPPEPPPEPPPRT